MSKFIVEYANERNDECQDPAFYVWDSQCHQFVASVRLADTDREVNVYCDGEMRLHVWADEKSREEATDFEVVRYCDDLASVGLNTDYDLVSADERIEWVNNAWFDLYANDTLVGDEGWLDCVTFTINDAIDEAKKLLVDDDVWKDAERK